MGDKKTPKDEKEIKRGNPIHIPWLRSGKDRAWNGEPFIDYNHGN